MKGYSYVYILQSTSDPKRHYTGLTDSLEDRLSHHNTGQCAHTSKHRPWVIRTATAFQNRERAAEFEKYLKSHSGRVFSSRHF